MDYPIRAADQLEPLLKAFRKAQHVSQSELAQQLGVTQQTFQQLESSPHRASFERILEVLAGLNVEIVLRQRDTSATPAAGDW